MSQSHAAIDAIHWLDPGLPDVDVIHWLPYLTSTSLDLGEPKLTFDLATEPPTPNPDWLWAPEAIDALPWGDKALCADPFSTTQDNQANTGYAPESKP